MLPRGTSSILIVELLLMINHLLWVIYPTRIITLSHTGDYRTTPSTILSSSQNGTSSDWIYWLDEYKYFFFPALVMRDSIAGDVFGDKRRVEEMQKIPLQLGTTLMNLDNAEFLSKQGVRHIILSIICFFLLQSPNRSESLLSILDNEKNEDSKAQSLKWVMIDRGIYE